MRFQLSIIIIVFMLCTIGTQSTSKYKGVSWNEKRNLWRVSFDINGKVKEFYFENEFDAAKKLNHLCDKMGIPPQNPEICELLNQEKKKKTSQYKGVFWHRERGSWFVLITLKGQKSKYGGYFTDELDAAKRSNQLCEELGIPLQNPEISAIPNQKYEKNEKTSQYKGVCWHRARGRWCVLIHPKGQKSKYGGYFIDELDAAKRSNQLCEELGIPLRNPEISTIPNQQYQKKEKTSQFKGVTWHKQSGKWQVQLQLNGQKSKHGGTFKDELDAGKRANQLCEELGIPPQNPEISAKPNEQYQKREKTSQYKGVSWNKRTRQWRVQLSCNGGNAKVYYFKDELDAAKRVNQLCEEMGIPLRNPEISAISNQQCQKKEQTSQYKGVTWHRKKKKWYVQLRGVCGGYFKDELNAGKRANQLCEELGISHQNPQISAIQNLQYRQACKPVVDYDVMQEEFEDLIKILGENNDPTSTIQKNLFAAINYGEQAIMTEINLRTQNGESALSLAAKHGFSNAVKFLISKGAEKEHFTNDHHTPLSLAVSQNHLKVVQVLFEDWISPNSNEKPYLHLSPIFQVKSREIAQLLIDNDAVTHEIYNGKNQSPLTVACQNGYLDVVEFFLDDGLEINHLDSDNKTPLFYALTNKHYDVVNLLISKGGENRVLTD